MELESQLELARDYGIVAPEAWAALTVDVVRVRKMVWTLRRKVLAAAPRN